MAKKTSNLKYYEAVGRRKKAVAQVRLYICAKQKEASVGTAKIKAGEIVVNGKPIKKLFPAEYEKEQYLMPFALTKTQDRFAVSVKVTGGGRVGQLVAMINGISRALVVADQTNYKPILRGYGFLTSDARKKQRRMVGTGGKARRKKQSPKR